jgi:hypothetical protein
MQGSPRGVTRPWGRQSFALSPFHGLQLKPSSRPQAQSFAARLPVPWIREYGGIRHPRVVPAVASMHDGVWLWKILPAGCCSAHQFRFDLTFEGRPEHKARPSLKNEFLSHLGLSEAVSIGWRC